MPVNNRIHGKHGQIKMDPTGGASPVVVADLHAWTLDMSTDKVEVTAFGDTNKRRVNGLPDFAGTLAGWWNAATSPAYFTAVLAGIAVFVQLIPSTDDPTVLFSGLANIDGSINVSATGAVSIAGKWDAAGNWTMAP